MHLNRLGLRNFKKYRSADIEFQDGLTGIVGSNGVGKSTIVEAIAWALYGNRASNITRELLRNSNSRDTDSVEASLRLSLGKQEITVIRAMRGKNLHPEAELSLDGHKIAVGYREVDQKLERLLKMSYQDFMRTFYARQKDLDNLLKEGGTGKREYLLKLLDLDEIREGSLEEMKSDLRDMEDKKNQLQGALTVLGNVEEIIKEASNSFAAAKEELAASRSIEAELAAEVDRKRSELELHAEKRRSHDLLSGSISIRESEYFEKMRTIKAEEAKIAEIEASKRTLAALEPSLKRLEIVKARLGQLDPRRKEYDRLQQKIIKTKTELELDQRALREQEQRLDALMLDRSSLKKVQPLENDYQDNLIGYGNLEALRDKYMELQARLKEERVRLDSVATNISRVDESINEILKARARIDEIQPLKRRCEALQKEFAEASIQKNKQKELDALTARVAAMEARRLRLEGQAASIRQELSALGDLDVRETELRRQDIELDRLASDLGNGLAELKSDLGIENSRRSEAMSNLTRVKSLGKEGNCPTCERPLGAQHVWLMKKYETTASGAEERIDELNRMVQSQTQKLNGVISARSNLKTSFDELSVKKSRLAELFADLRGLEAQLTEVGEEVKEIFRAIEGLGQVSFDSGCFESLQRKILELNPYVEEHKGLIFKLEELPKRELELDGLQREKQISAQKIEELNQRIQELGFTEQEYVLRRSRLKELKPHHDEFKHLSQRVQEIPLVEGRLQSLKDELDELEGTSKILQTAVQDLGFDPDEHDRLTEERTVLSRAEDSSHQIRSKIASESETRKRLAETATALKELETELSQARCLLESLGYSQELHETAKRILSGAEEGLKKARKEAFDKEMRLGVIDADLQRSVRDAERKKEYEKELNDINRGMQVVDVTRSLVNRFMDSILLRIRKDIAKTAGEILEEVSGKYSLMEIDDDFNIKVEDGGEYYPVSRYSGGETDMIAVSVRIAISEYLMRNGPQGESYSFIILDEIFGSQDLEHREKMIQMLRNLEERFPQVIAISHFSDVQGQFDNTIQVVEDEMGNSRVEAV